MKRRSGSANSADTCIRRILRCLLRTGHALRLCQSRFRLSDSGWDSSGFLQNIHRHTGNSATLVAASFRSLRSADTVVGVPLNFKWSAGAARARSMQYSTLCEQINNFMSRPFAGVWQISSYKASTRSSKLMLYLIALIRNVSSAKRNSTETLVGLGK